MLEPDIAVPLEDGRWVSENFERMARIVKDYDPWFVLRWIPPEMRSSPEDYKNAFAIVDTRTSEQGALVMTAAAHATPEEILEKLFLGDTHKHDVLAQIQARNAALKLMEQKKALDAIEEANDVAAFLVRSPLNTVRIHNTKGDLITMDHERRRVR